MYLQFTLFPHTDMPLVVEIPPHELTYSTVNDMIADILATQGYTKIQLIIWSQAKNINKPDIVFHLISKNQCVKIVACHKH